MVVGVFEAALAATVDPALVAANRARLVALGGGPVCGVVGFGGGAGRGGGRAGAGRGGGV
ncbi:PPE family protein [first part] [Mycobacterium tuberculosis]|nr:PPE family protein [first part] [Mycobacterium tuberculosis]